MNKITIAQQELPASGNQNPAADLWSDYLDAATSMSTDDSGLDLYDIEGMTEAAHDIYLALVASEASVAELDPEQVARIAKGETE